MALQNVGNGQMSYEDFVKQMQEAGLRTTRINEGKEANFADYGNALSEDLQNRITDSYDCEQDYALQSLIAGIYADNGTNYLNRADFIAACKSLGLTVSVDYQKSTYIPDYKAGNFDNSMSTASIGVYTISDGKGGEIVIADANGNGALEVEELFMNQILGDINYEISATKGAGATFGSHGADGATSTEGTDGNNMFAQEEGEGTEVKQATYDSKVETYLQAGYSMSEAVAKADNELGVENMTYAGTMQAIIEENIFELEEEEEAVA